jgi:hypothetical protein
VGELNPAAHGDPAKVAVPCAMNKSESCGAWMRILVYPFHCDGIAPVPSVHPTPTPGPTPPPRPQPPCAEFNQKNCSRLYNPCLDTTLPYHAMPFCNPTLPLETRAKDMITRMTLAEKIGTLGNSAPAVVGLGTNPYQWWEEASSGVDTRAKTGSATTKFAYPITTGMSFNRSLWRATGAQIGREARALMNDGELDSTFWAPVINLAREPRWGRCVSFVYDGR